MSSEQSFEEFIKWYTGLSNPSNLKNHVHEVAKMYDYSSISDDYSTVEYNDRDPQTGEYLEGEDNIDLGLYTYAMSYVNNPTEKIIPELKKKEQIEPLLASLRIAFKKSKENEFYDSFKRYRIGLYNIGQELKDITEAWIGPLKVAKKRDGEYGDKTVKAYELKPYLKMIQESDSHQEAINKLTESVEGFKWNPGNGELYFKKEGGINKSKVSDALRIIGIIKWGEDAPKAETIRDVLLK